MDLTNVSSADPLIRQMKDVIQKENERHILESYHLRHMDLLLLHTTARFQSQPEAVQDTLKIWLELLHNSLAHAESILDRPQQSPISCLDCFKCSPVRLSEEIKEWKALSNCLCKGLLTDFVKLVSDNQFVIDPVIQPTDIVIGQMKYVSNVIGEEKYRHILQTDLRTLNNLLVDVVHILDPQELALLDPQEPARELARELALLDPQDQQEPARELVKIWLQLLHNCLGEAKTILHRYDEQCLYSLMCNPGRLSEQVKDWKVHFNYLLQGFTVFVSDNINRDSLSKDEAWRLFKRIAFKNSPVSVDIEEHAKDIAEECRGLRVAKNSPAPMDIKEYEDEYEKDYEKACRGLRVEAIRVVAAAMIGKNSVDEWKSCLSSIKNADPDTEPHLDLYQQIRWCYDALPNSNVKNCFLYCAMFPSHELINVEKLVQMWIAEGLLRSKEGHLMDMVIGRSYINLLIQRCFFQNATATDTKNAWMLRELQRIRVHDAIRHVAMYIGENEEKCLFKAGEQLHNFPETHNEECTRISVRRNTIENLPTEFRRPKLVSLFLSLNPAIKEVPSGFLLSLTSLKVLDLSGEDGIRSIPSSIGQLKQLEFLNLSGQAIEDLPKEIGQLSSLQFLNISGCWRLQSLPSEIGGLTNLKSLDLSYCSSLRVIPDDFSQLTSLNKLDMWWVEGVSEASIWNMKDLRNLTMLRIGDISGGIKVGIMGTWLEMRHLWLHFEEGYSYELPQDMQNMSKLHSFIMGFHSGLSLPDHTFKFQHLEYIELLYCRHLKELSPLERLSNLKYLKLKGCSDLKELGIGNSGGFLMLEKLVLYNLEKLESIEGACSNGVWNETTLPRLLILMIYGCPLLKRLPVGMEKLPNLGSIIGKESWWQTIIWEDDTMKIHLQDLFTTSNLWNEEFQL